MAIGPGSIGAAQALLAGIRKRRRMGPTPPRSKGPKRPTRTITTGPGRSKPSKPIFGGNPGDFPVRRPTTRPLPAGPKKGGRPNRGPRRRLRSIAAGPIRAMSGRGGKRPTRRVTRRRSY